MFGELIPLGGGEPISLEKKILLLGRREDCDIPVPHTTVSGHHCRLFLNSGYWYVKDLNSRNGTRVNGIQVKDHRLDPGVILSLANFRYEVKYSPIDLGAVGPPPPDDIMDSPDEILSQSLLERASSSGIGLGSGIGKRKPGGSRVGKSKEAGLSGIAKRIASGFSGVKKRKK